MDNDRGIPKMGIPFAVQMVRLFEEAGPSGCSDNLFKEEKGI